MVLLEVSLSLRFLPIGERNYRVAVLLEETNAKECIDADQISCMIRSAFFVAIEFSLEVTRTPRKMK